MCVGATMTELDSGVEKKRKSRNAVQFHMEPFRRKGKKIHQIMHVNRGQNRNATFTLANLGNVCVCVFMCAFLH